MEHANVLRFALFGIFLALLMAGVALIFCGKSSSTSGFGGAQEGRASTTYASPGPLALTMRGRVDGLGAQLQAVLAVLATARRMGLPFVFAPLRIQDHEMDMRAVGLLLDHFAQKYPPLADHMVVEVNLLNDDPDAQAHHPDVFASANSILWQEEPEHAYTSELLMETRVAFLAAAVSSLSLSTLGDSDIAVHIRRGDVQSRTVLGKSRYVPMTFYEKLIPLLFREYPSHVMHVFSEGDQRDFQTLSATGKVMLHLNEPAHETFIQLMSAGTLVTSRSSFSYVAALLSQGHVYCFPFWHPPSPEWTRVEELGVTADYW